MTGSNWPAVGGTPRHRDWKRVAVALDEIQAARPGDGSGLDVPVPEAVIRTARALARQLRDGLGLPVPDGLYPLPDGEVVFEYYLPADTVVRYIVEPGDRVKVMTSYADGRPTRFHNLTVRPTDGFSDAGERRRRQNRQWGGLSDFRLAA